MSFLAIVLAVVAAFGVLLVVFRLMMTISPRPVDLLEARLGHFSEAGRALATLADGELALPSALDLLTISVEAGLSFDAAMPRVAEKYKNPLTSEITLMLNEIRLGRGRLEALDDLGKRGKVDELTPFVSAIIQSEQLGVGIANVLRIQSEEIRRKRR